MTFNLDWKMIKDTFPACDLEQKLSEFYEGWFSDL